MALPAADRILDCRGLMYPVPILKAEQALAELSYGQVLQVLATDANTKPDLATWSQRNNAVLLALEDSADGHYSFYLSKRSQPARTPAAGAAEENLFLVVLRSGLEAPSQVRSAFMYASLAAAMGQDTVIYCVQEGADAAKIDVAHKDRSPKSGPTITQRIQEALDMGVRLEVCEQTATVRNIQAADLIPQARLVGGASLIDYAIRARGSLTF